MAKVGAFGFYEPLALLNFEAKGIVSMSIKRDAGHVVAVTGIGMICPLGVDTHECWKNMLEGKSGVKRISRFDVSECLTQIAGQLPDKYFDWEKKGLTAQPL